jgi:hypothetical protein
LKKVLKTNGKEWRKKAVKKIVSCLFVALSLWVFALPLQAASDIHLYVNSEKIETDAAPKFVNGRTLVALASLKKLNLNLQWNQATKQVIVSSPNVKNQLVLTVGSKVAMMGNTKIPLDVPAQATKGRVFVPARFISETFQANIQWLKDTRSVVIKSADKKSMYEALYKGDDLVEARKIAVSLPTEDANQLSSTKEELLSHTLIFPQGEALRYYHIWGNLISYYEIKNDVKRLVWEGVEEGGKIVKEKGVRPPTEKSEVYFELARDSDEVFYGKQGEEQLVGKQTPGKYSDYFLSNAILPISGEGRIDQQK